MGRARGIKDVADCHWQRRWFDNRSVSAEKKTRLVNACFGARCPPALPWKAEDVCARVLCFALIPLPSQHPNQPHKK